MFRPSLSSAEKNQGRKLGRGIIRGRAWPGVVWKTEDPVVSTAWLANQLEDVSILDIRGHTVSSFLDEGVEKSEYKSDYDEYLEGHIPGAVFFDWTRDGLEQQSSVPVQLMYDSDEFAVVMEGKGVSTEKPVVVYGITRYDEGFGASFRSVNHRHSWSPHEFIDRILESVPVRITVHIMLVFPFLNFSLMLNLNSFLFPKARPLPEDTCRFTLLTVVLLVLVYFVSILVPNSWIVIEFTGVTVSVCLAFIFPGALALRDASGIATQKDKFPSLYSIIPEMRIYLSNGANLIPASISVVLAPVTVEQC